MPNQDLPELSDRELEILKLVATGLSNKEIAQQLFISLNTVKVHVRNIFAKIGVASRTEAALYAVRIGLVQAVSPEVMNQEDALPSINISETQIYTSDSTPDKQIKLPSSRNRLRSIVGLSFFGFIIVVLLFFGINYARENIFYIGTEPSPTTTSLERWNVLPGLIIPRRGMAVTSFESNIYAISGESDQGISAAVERYDPNSNLWISLTSKPTPVTDIQAAVIGGLIYIPGGKLNSGEPTKLTEIYDPRTDEWSEGVSLPKPLSAYASAEFEGRIYLFGGWDGNKIVNSVYMFDPGSNTWVDLPAMPTARSLAGAVLVGRNIYVIGGWDGEQALTVCEVFQPDTSTSSSQWSKSISLPSGRYAMGITNIADIIFIIGGTNSIDETAVIARSEEDANWGQVETPIDKGYYYLRTAAVGPKMYILGGESEESLNTQMWSYQAIYIITLPIIK
jgi:DNA-binding CsgD family transcriptional regulator